MPWFCLFSGVKISLFSKPECCPALASGRSVVAASLCCFGLQNPRIACVTCWRYCILPLLRLHGYKPCFSKSGKLGCGGGEDDNNHIRITLKATLGGDAVSVYLLRAEKRVNVCSRAEPSASGGWTTYEISISASRSSCLVMSTKSTGRQTKAQSLGCSTLILWNLKKARMRWDDFSLAHQL